MTYCCIKCGNSLPDPNARTDAICNACQSQLQNVRRQIDSHLETFSVRWRKSYSGVNLQHALEMIEWMSEQNEWTVEKLLKQLKEDAR